MSKKNRLWIAFAIAALGTVAIIQGCSKSSTTAAAASSSAVVKVGFP